MFPHWKWLHTTKRLHTLLITSDTYWKGGERDSRLWLEYGGARIHAGGSWNSLKQSMKRGEDLGFTPRYSLPLLFFFFCHTLVLFFHLHFC